MTELRVVQYNVHKRKDVMALLLRDPGAREIDIIAIQEPWLNTHAPATYCPSSCPFTPVFYEGSKRSCLLINKKLDINQWEARFTNKDLSSVRLQCENKTIWVHSIYSQPPGSYSAQARDYDNPLENLATLLEEEGACHHLIVGDLNLHHPVWSGARIPAAHTAAERLIEITHEQGGCQLLTPPGTITFPTSHGGTTIDLAFASEELVNSMLECRVIPELDHGSDHLPLILRFGITPPVANAKPRRCWKNIDLDRARACVADLDFARPINSTTEIEQYARYLSEHISYALDQSVPWKRASVYANPWWNSRVAKAVDEARVAHKAWLDTRSTDAKQRATELGRARAQVIAKAKQESYRQFTDEIAQGDGLWKLSRWSRGVGVGLPQVPTLKTEQAIADDYSSKVAMLRERFFPTITADLSDISSQVCQAPFSIEQSTSTEEIIATLASCSASSAPGDDEIPFSFLKALGEPVTQALTHLTNASLRLEHLPPFLKRARTIVIKKPGKGSYETPSAWRPIALLKTIGKVIEKVVAKRIREAAEARNLLPPQQMGARAGRGTGTALELLTSMVRTIWKEKKGQVASLLSLDISGAFDTVVHERLVAIIRRLGFPDWLQGWVRSFLAERSTTLLVNNVESEAFEVRAGVPQGSPLSPILFLLYNEELIRTCNQPSLGIHSLGFMDDLNILAYSGSTEQNCARLSRVHGRCQAWALRHGIAFAPHKYELIHFTTARKKHNLQASITLDSIVKEPTRSVRVLGVWLDPKLKWSAHAAIARQKGVAAIAALRRVTTSTWGASFVRARLLYNSVVRPIITYGTEAWFEPENTKHNKVVQAISKVQASGMRVVAGAFRATPVRELEAETFTPPLDVYCSELRARHIRRTYSSQVGSFIKEQCRMISSRLRRRGPQRISPQVVPVIQEKLDWALIRERTLGTNSKKAILQEWHGIWYSRQRRNRWCSLASTEAPSTSRLKLHEQLKKAESSVLVQARTGRIGLAHFLCKARVPGYETPACRCGLGDETAEHLLLHCRLETERRQWRRGTRLSDLVSEPSRAATTAKWIIQSSRLGQFQLASRLLYSGESSVGNREQIGE
jgi:exonuclease III